MRRFIAGLLMIGALVHPERTEALDCDWPMPYHFHRDPHAGEVTPEQQRHDAEARATLEQLDRMPIVFRGRLASSRYLSDPRKTNMPSSLLVFDRVEMLKGRLFTGPIDRKAFIVQGEWCDFRCNVRAPSKRPRDETVVLAARYNSFPDPKIVRGDDKRIIYKGRIDAVLGPCDGVELTSLALELLNTPEEEIARLKRDYVRRRAY